jgi:NAD(P)-dependent dehydrogenase (short-subunit alcohol dehydrogenase family)
MADGLPAGARRRQTDEESFGLNGAVAVVTGGTRGIGRETVLALAEAGASVVLVGRSRADGTRRVLPGTLESVAEEIAALGQRCRWVQADLTDAAAAQTVIDRTLEWYGRCDVLVNNAAYTSNGAILEVPWGRWEKGFRLQVTAPLQLIQGFVPGMLERGVGRVVNISSDAASHVAEGLSLYSVTKQAMERLTDYLHFELGGRGVSFNTLHIEVGVTTETWNFVVETQGRERATLGGMVTETTTPEQVAAQIRWMLLQPANWSGGTVTCREIAGLGGPSI